MVIKICNPNAIIYTVTNNKSVPKFTHAFHQGYFKHFGYVPESTESTELISDKNRPIIIFGDPQNYNVVVEAQKQHIHYYYGDHAYFGRKVWFRITKNALQHNGLGDYGPKRWEKIAKKCGLELSKRNLNGKYILIAPPEAYTCKIHNISYDIWLGEVIQMLKQYTDREIIIRTKGFRMSIPPKEHLKEAWATITHSSNFAIDSLMAGVPVFCTERCAGFLSGSSILGSIEDPYFPDNRDQVFWNLSHHQWTLEELKDGQFLTGLW